MKLSKILIQIKSLCIAEERNISYTFRIKLICFPLLSRNIFFEIFAKLNFRFEEIVQKGLFLSKLCYLEIQIRVKFLETICSFQTLLYRIPYNRTLLKVICFFQTFSVWNLCFWETVKRGLFLKSSYRLYLKSLEFLILRKC